MRNIFYVIEDRFDDDGEYNLPVNVSADKLTPETHEPLFNFLRHDLAPLNTALTDYMGTFDINTLVVDKKGKKNKLQKISDALKTAHPFYNFGANTVYEINHAVKTWLNYVLHENGHGREQLLPMEKYIELLGALSTADFKHYDSDYLEGLYDEYTRFSPGSFYTPEEACGFQRLSDAKDTIQKMLYWIFDFSVQDLAHLTTYQRAHLYDNLFVGNYDSILEVEKSYSFDTSAYRHMSAVLAFSDESYMAEIINLHRTTDEGAGIPDLLKELIDDAQQVSVNPIRELCTITGLEQLLTLELVNMLDQNILVKRCRYCGNYFIADNLKNEYCNGFAPNEKKPCSEIGSQRVYQSKIKKDDVYILYQRAYKTHFARIKKGKMTTAAFNTWSIEAKQKMADVREGRLSMEDYEAWLVTSKNPKKTSAPYAIT